MSTDNSDHILNKEKPYKNDLNMEEIHKIKDLGLREIRLKYWHQRHNAFLDENRIPDLELENVLNTIDLAEQEELTQYRICNAKQFLD